MNIADIFLTLPHPSRSTMLSAAENNSFNVCLERCEDALRQNQELRNALADAATYRDMCSLRDRLPIPGDAHLDAFGDTLWSRFINLIDQYDFVRKGESDLSRIAVALGLSSDSDLLTIIEAAHGYVWYVQDAEEI